MRLLVVNYEYPPLGGGGGVLCRDMCECMVRMGHEVTVLTSGFQNLAAQETCNGVKIERVPVWFRFGNQTASIASMLSFYPLAYRTGRRLLQQYGFDLINSYFAIPSGPVGHALGKYSGLPNVLFLLGGDVYDPSKTLSPHRTPLLRQTVGHMIRKANAVMAGSENTHNSARRYYRSQRSIDVVPLGLRLANPVVASKTRLGLNDQYAVLCTIGRLVRRKNIPELIDILARVNQSTPTTLVIMGDGPEAANIRDYAGQQGLDQQVILAGRVDEHRKQQYLAAADLYVSASMHEGFGLVFLEAMQAGLPVVCYDNGGQTDFLEDGRTGYLIRLGDKKTFSEQISALLQDPAKQATMARYNKTKVSSYDIDHCTQQYLKIFQRTLDASPVVTNFT
ncbi:MAG TPA: glycosyltransferase family 1 protein [Gammaproteobacteria bacterium]|nr:glycosyltransferase family 1 protein [Gammaproteobacteria bacterium]